MDVNSIEYFLTKELDFSIFKREKAKIWVEKENFSSKLLIQLLKQTNQKPFAYLLCFFETFCREHPSYFINEIDFFIELAYIETNESNKRSLSNIFITWLTFYYDEFSSKQKEQMAEVSFNWLIDESLIATQCNCLTCLDLLSKDSEWIKDELLLIIDKNFTDKPASYQSRAKKIMKKYRSI